MVRTVGGSGRRRRPASRAGRPVLDPQRIAACGLELLAADGAGALTVGEVARRLDVSSRAIYHWVASRRDLVGAVVALAQLSLPTPQDTGDWRLDLLNYRDATWAWMDRYRGVVDLIVDEGLAVVTPPVLRAQETTLAIVSRGAGLSPRQSHVAAAELARWIGATHRYLLSGPNPALYDDVVGAAESAAGIDPERYPLLAAAGTIPAAEQLDVGFTMLLDAIARLAD